MNTFLSVFPPYLQSAIEYCNGRVLSGELKIMINNAGILTSEIFVTCMFYLFKHL